MPAEDDDRAPRRERLGEHGVALAAKAQRPAQDANHPANDAGERAVSQGSAVLDSVHSGASSWPRVSSGPMDEMARIEIDGKSYEFPTTTGSEGERAIDIGKLRDLTGLITLDPGYKNTGSCKSAITFIDGEQGILRYRGYPIEELAEKSNFLEVAYLLIHGELPTAEQYRVWANDIRYHTMLHEDLKRFFSAFPKDAHPMGVCSAVISALSTFYPEDLDPTRRQAGRGQHPPADREVPDDRRLREQALDRPPVPVPGQQARLRRELPAPDVRHALRGLRERPGGDARGRRAADPARRPRAELLDVDGAPRGQLAREPLRVHVGGHRRALGPAPRRREPGSDRDARGDRGGGPLREPVRATARSRRTTPRG